MFHSGALNYMVDDMDVGEVDLNARVQVQSSQYRSLSNVHAYNFPLHHKDISNCAPRMRFAPSPTGSLHVGGARTALYNWLYVQKSQRNFSYDDDGAFILRVEDTDLDRSTKNSETSLLADMTWLGLTWDEGPDDVMSPYGPYRQSERSELYAAVAGDLLADGKAYRCFCTKEELAEIKMRQEENGQPSRYNGAWRDADPELVRQKLEEGTPHTIRFKIPADTRIVIDDIVRGTISWDAESTVGDFVLLRSNGVPVYNFCVAVDDATMGITTVIRAEDHLTNTLRQGLVLDALGAPRPKYAHCSLILGRDGQKLSKRHDAMSIHQFQLDGFLPDAMINYLALLGWNDRTGNEIFSRKELIDAFDVNLIGKSPSIFDMEKLRWVNQQHLKQKSVEDVVDLVMKQMEMFGLFKNVNVDQFHKKKYMMAFAATSLAKQMMETTQDAANNFQNVLGYGLSNAFDNLKPNSGSRELIEQGYFYTVANALLKSVDDGTWPMPDPTDPLSIFTDSKGKDVDEVYSIGNVGTGMDFPYSYAYTLQMKHLAKKLNIKGRHLFHPVRLALTGEMNGQDVRKQLTLLSMASRKDSVVDMKRANVVTFEERVARLKVFCETIPEEFHVSK